MQVGVSMVHSIPCWFILAGLLLATGSAPADDELAMPDPPANLEQFGSKIQRTMTLLATSTPEKRNHVRILFYGQSVTANPWAAALGKDLEQAFPHADIEIENRAIGGYSSTSTAGSNPASRSGSSPAPAGGPPPRSCSGPVTSAGPGTCREMAPPTIRGPSLSTRRTRNAPTCCARWPSSTAASLPKCARRSVRI